MLEQFPNMEKGVINDINTDLTNCYISIKEDVENLITEALWEYLSERVPLGESSTVSDVRVDS